MPDPRPPAAPSLNSLGLSTDRPLVIVDVDEVLGLFMKGFGDYVARQGIEMRVERFALFQSLYRPGESQHLPLEEGRALFDAYFREGCGEMEPVPGAVDALRRLSLRAEILILSNAPAEAERLRAGWLHRHGLPRALILNTGPKGPVTAALVGQTPHATAFVDDLLSNLDSVAEHAPQTARFQHVADERLRPFAPTSDLHVRIDDWTDLGLAIEEAISR